VVVTDLSFISLTTVLPDLARLMEPSGHLVALVKPQFEVGRERLGKKGIVRSLVEHRRVLASVVEAATASRLHVRGLLQSPISGSQGNVEYLMWVMSPPCVKMDPAAIAQEIVALTTPPGREARTTGGLR
jgi:23S rRNA (cytidine1920-2'-O)/16S rRNA (cytidine1409-2'-O)-methyltransferase